MQGMKINASGENVIKKLISTMSVAVLFVIFMVLTIAYENRLRYEIVSGNEIINVGDTVSINLVAYRHVDGVEVKVPIPENVSVGYTSINPDIVSVNSVGYMTALSKGVANVEVTVGKIVLAKEYSVVIPAEAIEFSQKSYTIDISEISDELMIRVIPEEAELTESIVYTSSNPDIVSVSENGVFYALSPGKVSVKAWAQGLEARCDIDVTAHLQGIEIDKDAIELVGENASDKIGVKYIPDNYTDDLVAEYTSSDENVVVVDEEGNVKIVGPGQAVIKAIAGNYIQECTVRTSLPMTGIYFGSANITMAKGTTGQLKVGYLPDKTEDDRTTTYVSSDSAIVSVDQYGNVAALSTGVATITAECNGFAASCNIVVNIPVTSVTLNKTATTINKGSQDTLTALVGPADTTESTVVSWSSSNGMVATVAGGVVTAVAPGQATITAKCGNVTASCLVTVPQPVVAPVNTGNGRVIVLDPGHDGIHGGASYFGRNEQDLTLTVARYCKSYLESNYGVTVYMTRNGGESLSPSRDQCLINRCAYAKNVGAATLVSLHFNSSGGGGASGAMVIVSTHPNVANQSTALGNSILNQLCALGLRNNGLLRRFSATYHNADGTPMDYYSITRNSALLGVTAVIVEHCYMDYDVNYISSDSALMQLGIADAIGIANYLGL